MFGKLLISLHSRFFNAIIPPICTLCGNLARQPYSLCLPCETDLPSLPLNLTHYCPQCAQYSPAAIHGLRCGACLAYPPSYDQTFALFHYQTVIIPLIIKLKFMGKLSIAETFGRLLSNRILKNWYAHTSLPDLIIPVPLHPQRLRERGFNQALEIARPIAKTLKRPIDYTSLIRRKATLPQSELPAAKRAANIAHAFQTKMRFDDLTIAVIDDVMTTGHTLKACCRILKQQGAKRIDIWCVARRTLAL